MVSFYVYDIHHTQLRNVIEYFRTHLPHPIVFIQEIFDDGWILLIEVRKELLMQDVPALQLTFGNYEISCMPGEDDNIPDEELNDDQIRRPLTNDEFEDNYNRINVSVYTQMNNLI
jgi:hypothetical protein